MGPYLLLLNPTNTPSGQVPASQPGLCRVSKLSEDSPTLRHLGCKRSLTESMTGQPEK